jgi:hypothetical protein
VVISPVIFRKSEYNTNLKTKQIKTSVIFAVLPREGLEELKITRTVMGLGNYKGFTNGMIVVRRQKG